MENLEKLIRKGINRFGYDFHGIYSSPNLFFQLIKGLVRFEIDLILDVGANVGQFATGLRDAGYNGNLVSFEPLTSAHILLAKAAESDSRWFVHPRCAIGGHNGEIDINIADNSVSSSLLPITDIHRSAEAKSVYMGTEKTPIFTLDSVSKEYLNKPCRPFLKIDTQGFEWQVLDGAKESLPHLQGIMCELSLASLYEGQHLWLDIIARLESEGFALWSMQKGFSDPTDGRMLQMDATFFRTN